MAVTKVEITIIENGVKTIKTLEGTEAFRWHEWIRSVCVFAEENGRNPEWKSLMWREKYISPEKKSLVKRT